MGTLIEFPTTPFDLDDSMIFSVGSIAILNSDGPEMTVVAVDGEGCSCAWFVNRELRIVKFPPATLVLKASPGLTVN